MVCQGASKIAIYEEIPDSHVFLDIVEARRASGAHRLNILLTKIESGSAVNKPAQSMNRARQPVCKTRDSANEGSLPGVCLLPVREH